MKLIRSGCSLVVRWMAGVIDDFADGLRRAYAVGIVGTVYLLVVLALILRAFA